MGNGVGGRTESKWIAGYVTGSCSGQQHITRAGEKGLWRPGQARFRGIQGRKVGQDRLGG